MPYKNKEEQRAAQRESYRRRYKRKWFAKDEADRKADWLQTLDGQLSNYAATVRYREKEAGERRKPAKLQLREAQGLALRR